MAHRFAACMPCPGVGWILDTDEDTGERFWYLPVEARQAVTLSETVRAMFIPAAAKALQAFITGIAGLRDVYGPVTHWHIDTKTREVSATLRFAADTSDGYTFGTVAHRAGLGCFARTDLGAEERELVAWQGQLRTLGEACILDKDLFAYAFHRLPAEDCARVKARLQEQRPDDWQTWIPIP